MRKNYVSAAFLTAVLMMSSTPVFASAKIMPDGGLFDAQYYASANADVAGAVGTDENALYRHYLLFGKGEGRSPVRPSGEGISANIREQCISNTLKTFMNSYPEGSSWDGTKRYAVKWMQTRTVQIEKGTGSHAFALLFSDTAFAKGTPFRKIEACSFSDMIPGDVVRKGSCSVVVLAKDEGGALVASAGEDGVVHYGLYVSEKELSKNDYVIRR